MNWKPVARELLAYWFGSMDDNTVLDPSVEPFGTHLRRWYGKDEAIDADIERRFGAVYRRVTSTPAVWQELFWEVGHNPRESLALTLLLDQVPRNMHRDDPQMYAHDHLAGAWAFRCVAAGHAAHLSLLERLFAFVPFLHGEDLALLQFAEHAFGELLDDARSRRPSDHAFFERALTSARLHRSVVERFGRFPHRNDLLGRRSTEEEKRALASEDIWF